MTWTSAVTVFAVAGILSPTDILVIGPGVATQMPALTRFQHELAVQPGVAELAGPATLHDVSGVLAGSPNPLLAKSGNAARFVMVQNTDPLDATAISQLRALTGRLPSLARSAGRASGWRSAERPRWPATRSVLSSPTWVVSWWPSSWCRWSCWRCSCGR